MSWDKTFDRYREILVTQNPEFKNVANNEFTPCAGDETNDWHLMWMIYQVQTDRNMGVVKSHRWIGYIQGVMVMKDYITVTEERELTRGLDDMLPVFAKDNVLVLANDPALTLYGSKEDTEELTLNLRSPYKNLFQDREKVGALYPLLGNPLALFLLPYLMELPIIGEEQQKAFDRELLVVGTSIGLGEIMSNIQRFKNSEETDDGNA